MNELANLFVYKMPRQIDENDIDQILISLTEPTKSVIILKNKLKTQKIQDVIIRNENSQFKVIGGLLP